MSDHEAAAIEFNAVSKQYDSRRVVDGLSFHVSRGECFGLLGPNGAGKTTTIKMLLGLARADAGSITLAGYPIPARASQARARIGVVPQFDNLDPDFTVAENLLIFARYFGIKREVASRRLPALLDFVRLAERANDRVSKLSGGMKRRLTLARALINEPSVLIMDEPTTGLDPQARHLIWERLRQLIDQGMTLLLTTHFMEEAERLCDRLCIIEGGRKLVEGSPRHLVDEVIGSEVIELFGASARELAPRLEPLANRVDVSGETVFCYVSDPEPIDALLRVQPGIRRMHRAANLEDVFLRLTGREMID